MADSAPSSSPLSLLLIVAGPAGSGKTTLCERLVREYPQVRRVVTSTTRTPREGELHGRDYFFFSDSEFEEKKARGEFLETALVHGRRYGTLRHVIEENLSAGIDLVMNIDVQGVRQLVATASTQPALAQRIVTVFIMPPSLEELRRRLRGRGQDSENEIERRLHTAANEIPTWKEFGFCLSSQDPETDFRNLLAIWRAEKQRVARWLGLGMDPAP